MAMRGPRPNRSANEPAGNARRSHGRLSAAMTAETASGWGLTTTAMRGTAPVAIPSPELASVKPTHRRAKGRPRGFLRMRCLARPRTLTEPAAVSLATECQALAWVPAGFPSGFLTRHSGYRISVKQFAKGGSPLCRKTLGNAPYQCRDEAITLIGSSVAELSPSVDLLS